MIEKIITFVIFIACYSLAISRKIKIAYVSLTAAGLLILFGIISPETVIFKSIKWDVLGIYWGFMMLSFIFSESGMPEFIANKIVKNVKKEKYVLFTICSITALFSAFMENVGVVLIIAPIAMEISKKLRSNPFPYIVAIAISSNAVTTLTMIADPPAIILAMETGMKFFDFYWFQNKISIGVITFFGVLAALLSLLLIFRKMKKTVHIKEEKIKVDYKPSILFILSIISIAFLPEFGIRPGLIGLITGFISLLIGRKMIKKMIIDFDWNSFFFILGIFVVISSLEITGLLTDFANWIGGFGISNASLMLAIIIWVSVLASSFIDNVPYTIIMIPVCNQLASIMGVNPFLFLFGMLIGTGTGGNITPVGATANIFACGFLEKKKQKIRLKEYVKISLPFTITAVLVSHILLQIIWM
jgi:Na+/H+ antiporter NhaD/arsenite permease-like protein